MTFKLSIGNVSLDITNPGWLGLKSLCFYSIAVREAFQKLKHHSADLMWDWASTASLIFTMHKSAHFSLVKSNLFLTSVSHFTLLLRVREHRVHFSTWKSCWGVWRHLSHVPSSHWCGDGTEGLKPWQSGGKKRGVSEEGWREWGGGTDFQPAGSIGPK